MPLAKRSPQRLNGPPFGHPDYPGPDVRTGEAVWTFILILISVGSIVTVSSLSVLTAHDPLGPRFFPLVISLILMGAALVILLKPILAMALGHPTPLPRKPESSPPLAGVDWQLVKPKPFPERPLVRVAFMGAVCSAYVVLMDVVGYIPATVLGMAGVLLILDSQRTRRLIIAPAASAISIYLLFTNVLHVRLP